MTMESYPVMAQSNVKKKRKEARGTNKKYYGHSAAKVAPGPSTIAQLATCTSTNTKASSITPSSSLADWSSLLIPTQQHGLPLQLLQLVPTTPSPHAFGCSSSISPPREGPAEFLVAMLLTQPLKWPYKTWTEAGYKGRGKEGVKGASHVRVEKREEKKTKWSGLCF